jgi:hypothetical protein
VKDWMSRTGDDSYIEMRVMVLGEGRKEERREGRRKELERRNLEGSCLREGII